MIVITTPTGQIGQQVLERIVDSGKPIRVIARDPSRLPQRMRDRVEVFQGSHDDMDVVSKAFAGAESVLWLVPPNPQSGNSTEYYLNFTRPACQAIQSLGVKRVVGVSSLGRGFGRHAGILTAAFEMDALIESTGVSYRSLRMPYFMENMFHDLESIKSHGTFYMPTAGDQVLPLCATRDIASTAAALLLDESWSGQDSVPVVSPDSLTPNEMAHVLSEVLERPIRFQQVSIAEYKATLSRFGTEAWVKDYMDMVIAQNEGIYDDDLQKAQPSDTSFRTWCEEVFKPAVLAP
ncbi:NmrA family NAD(P)-binding protein [Paenibacillus cineris]|uniref:NmrA family NAD(P)-binding protein n=1 Tax=Paenibacillus cineris TaxID=237530 RepID=UPI001B28029C|nr:NAD(P)H-binding protein [Paenibacillus cineris]GIO64289.1 NmrA family transcriptional regulator [Paenibacillus cineris]